jgi:hypothetical protein
MASLLAVQEWNQWTIIVPVALALVILIVGKIWDRFSGRKS